LGHDLGWFCNAGARGKVEIKNGAFARLACDSNVSAVRFDDLLYNGKAQSHATLFPRVGFEFIEDFCNSFFRNSLSADRISLCDANGDVGCTAVLRKAGLAKDEDGDDISA
jgi:hypothetical protein